MWAEGIKSDFTIKSQRFPATAGANYPPPDSFGSPICGWWELGRRNLLISGYAGMAFKARRLSDSYILTGLPADPPDALVWQPPAPTGNTDVAYLRAGKDGRFWLLRPEPTSGDLGFVRLEKFGDAGSAGSWV
jgi:hypothetical protein